MTEWAESGFVYFIGCDGSDLIKIGYSVAPELRLSVMRPLSPVPLRLIAMFRAGLATERSLHRRFKAYRQHHEWYRPSGALLKLVREHAVHERDVA